jgi:hypothetical protein
MRKPNRQRRRVRLNPPWNDKHIGRYSLEEIALEFILWEDARTPAERRGDAMRRDFIHQALDQSFGEEDRAETLRQFFTTYERLYEKIYQPQHGDKVKQDRATPESMRQLLDCPVEKEAA